MSVSGTYTETPAIFLRPRPLSRTPGSFMLLPLLPRPRPVKPLPAEVWSKVLSYVVDDEEGGRMGIPVRRALLREKWKLLFVCKSWVNVVLPLLYSRVQIFTVTTLGKFVAHLSSSDTRWDSIRRIPYSTPGRWIALVHSTDLLLVDSNITRLFPLLPFLTSLYLVPEILLSNRALDALHIKDGIGQLRSLKGIKISAPVGHSSTLPLVPNPDAVIQLLQSCPRLEQLEIACDPRSLREQGAALPPLLHLPNLKFLCLSAIPICRLFLAILSTPLPELRHLAVTPYGGQRTSQLSALLAAHGRGLPRHLLVPIGDLPAPPVLTSCPELHYLSLDRPLPVLTLPALAQDAESSHPHPLRVVTIPRPNARFLREVEAVLPRLPSLTVVRVRAVRWLRSGVSGKALEAGVQGEMRDWRCRLMRKGVRLVDNEWRDPE
ncbi:hypothetical protein F5148DRAFT_1274298 [Russula earlei]|uniref:Uncharacterized protein n=1 Tax=Russula earlei TaxID=71964 RepID=A0ACC0UHW6_9AGAM|nr:hypothetical protein F5148DRAFT_1274298 [Russula earlei]